MSASGNAKWGTVRPSMAQSPRFRSRVNVSAIVESHAAACCFYPVYCRGKAGH